MAMRLVAIAFLLFFGLAGNARAEYTRATKSGLDFYQGGNIVSSDFTMVSGKLLGRTSADTGAVQAISPDATIIVSNQTVGINLNNPNTWTAPQAISISSTGDERPILNISKTYTGTALFTGFNDVTTLNQAASNQPFTFSSAYFGVTDNTPYTGEIEDNSNEKSVLDAAYFINGASDVNWIDGSQTYKSTNSYMFSSAAMTGYKHDVTMIGHDMTVYNANSFNFSDGTWSQTVIGNRIVVQNDGVLTAGTLTRTTRGLFISAGTASTGSSTASGIWIDSVAGGDTNYSIYSNSSSPSIFTGNITAAKFIMASQQTYTPSNVTTDRTYDADATSTAELADIVGTLIADLKTVGLIA